MQFCWDYRNKLMVAVVAVYVATVLIGVWLLRQVPDDSAWRYAITLLPLSGAFAFVFAAVRVTMMGDEMEQRAAAIGATATLVFVSTVAIGWGILESFAGMPPISALWWGTMSMGVWGLVTLVVWHRFQ